MTAYAYIDVADIPPNVMEKRSLRNDDATHEVQIAFDGCPFAGYYKVGGPGGDHIEFIFPRAPSVRNSLVEWFMHHGIHFRVIM